MVEKAQQINLRDYQQQAMKLTFDCVRRNRRTLMVAPTGSGKRIMLAWMTIKGAVEKGRRILVVTDRRTLVQQMADECDNFGIPHGIIMGSEPRNDSALVQIASIQTLQRRRWKDVPDSDLVLVDEAHKASKGYKTLFEKCPTAKVLGVTATPVGAAGKSLIPDLFDEMVEGATNTQLIDAGHILPTKCHCPSEPDTAGVKVTAGEFNQKQIGQRVEDCFVFANVFDYWQPYSHMQTIVFSPRVAFAHGLAKQFSDKGFPAEVIEASTVKNDRSDIFERFANRQTRVLVSVDVLREGFDAPIAQCGIDLQPNKQFRTYAQKVGRIRRPYPGQDHAVWLDFAGNFWRFYHPDEDPDWRAVTEATSIQDVIAGDRKPQRCPACKQGSIVKGQCNHCGERFNKSPWMCPKCNYTKSPWETIKGGICPNCGHKGGRPMRKVRMGDGTLTEVPLAEKKKKKSSKGDNWKNYLFKGAFSGWTLGKARAIYIKETGQWPRGDGVPHPSSGDWDLPITTVYPGIGRYVRNKREERRG